MNLYIPEKPKTSILKIKQSKFISYLRMCDTQTEFKSWLSQVKRDHYDSSHVCWGYALGRDLKIEYHSSDGGEPSGTAGKPILKIIKASNLIQSGLIVVRYFGGSKLGRRGLIDAYSSAAKNVVIRTRLIKWINTIKFLITCPLEYYGEMYDALSKVHGNIIVDKSNDHSRWVIEIQVEMISELIQKTRKITRGEGEMKKLE